MIRPFDLTPVPGLDTSRVGLAGQPAPEIGEVLAAYSSLAPDGVWTFSGSGLNQQQPARPVYTKGKGERHFQAAAMALVAWGGGFVVLLNALHDETLAAVGSFAGAIAVHQLIWQLTKPKSTTPPLWGDGLYIGRLGYTRFVLDSGRLDTKTVLYANAPLQFCDRDIEVLVFRNGPNTSVTKNQFDTVSCYGTDLGLIDSLHGGSKLEDPRGRPLKEPSAAMAAVRVVERLLATSAESAMRRALSTGGRVEFPVFRRKKDEIAPAVVPDGRAIVLQGDTIGFVGERLGTADRLPRSNVRYRVNEGHAEFLAPDGRVLVSYDRRCVSNVAALESLLAS